MKKYVIRFFALILTLSCSIDAVAESGRDSMTVLIFNSWNPDFYFTKAQVTGIQDQLRAKFNGKEIQFIVEYMDLPRLEGIPKDKFLAAYYQLFRNKYLSRKIQFDTIYVTDDPALEFMVSHRNEFFPNVPVVFSGINNFDARSLEGKGFIGVLEKVDYLGTFSLALKLHSNTKRFVVIGDQRQSSQGQINEIKALASSFPVEFVYLDNLPFNQLAQRLQSLNKDDIAFRVAFYTDPNGANMTLNESMQFLRDNVSVPLYSFWKGVLDKGIVGGKLLSGYEHGQQAVNKYYQSDPVQRSNIDSGDNPYMFNYVQLKNFDIELNQLPKNSTIINKPFSFFNTYKTLVISTLVFITILFSLLLFLLHNIRIRKIAIKKAKAADHSKSEFLSVISHELRTPMNGIIGGLEIVKEQLSKNQQGATAIIQKSADDMMRLINDIITYTEFQGGLLHFKQENVNLLECFNKIRSIYEPLCIDKGLQFNWQCNETVPKWLKADGDKLVTVISKLLDNALLFTERGKIAFSAHCDRDGEHWRLVCSVNDTGIGIAESDKANVFKVFQQIDSGLQRKYGGLGVSLANCKELVNVMGGSLTVESKQAKGTTFTLNIPILEGVAKEPLSEALQIPRAIHPILIVEDNKVNQLILAAMLKKLGYKAIIAIHGQDALNILEKEKVSLVLMDLQMPVMDGFTCTKVIRERDDELSHIPIIAVTANLLDSDKERCFIEGMNGYLPKPVVPYSLEELLTKYLSPSGATPSFYSNKGGTQNR